MMKIIGAVEARKGFGHLLEMVRHEPVIITKKEREIVAMLSIEDIRALADAFLSEPLKEEVVVGKQHVAQALTAQLAINKRLEVSRQAIAEGRGVLADVGYFQFLRDRAMCRQSHIMLKQNRKVILSPRVDAVILSIIDYAHSDEISSVLDFLKNFQHHVAHTLNADLPGGAKFQGKVRFNSFFGYTYLYEYDLGRGEVYVLDLAVNSWIFS